MTVRRDPPPTEDAAELVVDGTVRDPGGEPVAGVAVHVLDRDLRSSQLLGKTETDRDGRYRVAYGAEQFAAGELGRADVQVVLLDGRDELMRSEVRFNAGPAETIDLTLAGRGGGRGSEYERYLRMLEPVLDGLALTDVREDAEHQDIAFLSGETGIARERVEMIAQAAREAAADPPLPAEAFYGWFRRELPRDRAALLAAPTSTLIAALKEAIERQLVPSRLAKAIARIERELTALRSERMLQPADGDAAPTLGDVLAVAGKDEALAPDTAARLAGLVADRAAADDTLEDAREALELGPAQLAALRRGLALRHVAGSATAMREVEGIRPRLADGCDQLPFAGISALTESEWVAAIGAGAAGAGEAELRADAREALDRTATLVPHDVLLAPAARRPSLKGLAALVKRADANDDDATGELRTLAGAYPGLRLGEVLDGGGDAGARAAEIDRRLAVVGRVYAANADVPILSLDYLPEGDAEDVLDFDGVDASDRRLLLDTFKAMRRMQEVTGLASDTRRLLGAGYGAAAHLAGADPAEVAAATGIGVAQAYAYVRTATDKATQAAVSLFGAHAIGAAAYGKRVSGSSAAVADYLTRIPGYAELFGSTAFCDCCHCESVLSPAAYLVDLMWFVQRTLTDKAYAGAPDHPLRLEARRGDLWDLPLTCANTDGLVPYLDIVNEILEAHVGGALAAPALTPPQVYRRLARTTASVTQPFHLPLERATAYLGHFRRTRADVARSLVADATSYARAALGASVTVWDLLVRPRATDAAFLEREFSAPVVAAARAGTDVDVQLLLAATNWSRQALGELLAASVVRGGDQPAIRPDKQPADSVQNNVELLRGLTTGVLDRLGRLWRLHAATGVPIAALDVVVRALPAPAAGADESERLLGVVAILEAAQRLGVSIDSAVAFAGPIPTTPLDPGGAALFDLLFNLEPFVTQQGRWPEQMPASFVHPSFAASGTSTPDNRTLQRLLAGLRVSDEELVELFAQTGLATVAAPRAALDVDVLALLFRHATIARGLGVPIADLGRLLRLAGVGRVNVGTAAVPVWAHRVTGLDDLRAALAAVEDWKTLDVSLDDAEYVVEGRIAQPGHRTAEGVAAAIATQLERERPWEFADTMLASIGGISEADSRRILAENVAGSAADDVARRPLEAAPGSSMLRVRAAVDPTAAAFSLTLPPGLALPAGVSADDLAAAVGRFDPLAAIAQTLATALAVTTATLTELLRLSGPAGDVAQSLAANRRALSDAVYAADAVQLAAALLAVRPALLRLAVLFDSPGWDDAAVRRVADDREAGAPRGIVFAAPEVDLSWRAVVEARLLMSLMSEPLAPDAGDDASRPDPAAVLRALGIADWASSAGDVDLAAALATDRAAIAGMRPSMPLASIDRPLRRLQRLRDALRLSRTLGISGETLRTIVPRVAPGDVSAAAADAEYDALAQGADALYGVLRTVYPDTAAFEERLAPFEDLMRGRRRDALVDVLLHPGPIALPVTFASERELYGYFLLDVEMGGCARTSRIVAATQSVQLYVHRVLMSLEGSMWDGAEAGVPESAIAAVKAEWDWRSRYRVWEANRKIFLYPESYLEPELRDDRTPLFDDVAAELLQQETTEDNVSAGYSRYLSDLDDLMGLRVAGVFHEAGDGGDVMHVVAATSSDPPEHYYRAVRNVGAQVDGEDAPRAVFGPWRKMQVKIPAREVAPAVIGARPHVFWIESATKAVNTQVGDTYSFAGYDHRIQTRFTVLQADGRWSAPQALTLLETPTVVRQVLRDRLIVRLPAAGGDLNAPPPATGRTQTPQLSEREGVPENHLEPREGYGLPGPVLGNVQLDVLQRDAGAEELRAQVGDLLTSVDLFRREALAIDVDPLMIEMFTVDDMLALSTTGSSVELYSRRLTHDGYSTGASSVHAFAARAAVAPRGQGNAVDTVLAELPARTRATIVRKAVPTVGTLGRLGFDLVVEFDGQPVLVLGTATGVHLVRLGTGLGGRLSRQLFTELLPGVLATTFQESCVEPALSIAPVAGRIAPPPSEPGNGRLDVDGPVGTYLREVWFELPYLIAGHLNSQQRFAAAQRWYHHLFDPTHVGDPASVDRVWRYRGLRNVTVDSLRTSLTDWPALDAYRTDPFNPHAIARLRPGSHQKAVVMRYVDNLIDWGDSLFAEFTRESLNEAAMLYTLAADVLGPRPVDVGDCGEGAIQPRTYRHIEPVLGTTSDFLIELELIAPGRSRDRAAARDRYRIDIDLTLLADDVATVSRRSRQVAVRRSVAHAAAVGPGAPAGAPGPGAAFDGDVGPSHGSLWRTAGGTPIAARGSGPVAGLGMTIAGGDARRIAVDGTPVNPSLPVTTGAGAVGLKPYGDDTILPFDYDPLKGAVEPFRPAFDDRGPFHGRYEPPALSLAKQSAGKAAVFCIPPNRDLLAYWDRVEDRLNKIRNCMDITGAKREPSLFAPELDPLMLARARAAGLSIDDVLSAGRGSVPPYRFTHVIDRARQYAQGVQAFATALLTALERKDAEELGRLRNAHELNLLRLRSRVMEWEVAAATDAVDALVRQRESVEYRQGYYATLRAGSLSGWERTQQQSRHAATLSHGVAATVAFAAAIARFTPNAGSPFAITYGGIQIGGALGQIAGGASALASAAEAVSSSAGLEAGFQRRGEEWAHQQKLAELELLGLDRQIASAQLRVDIAERTREAHERSIDQAQELRDFDAAKFTSIDRYTTRAAQLHRLHREAFNTALAVARMAERAFQFERGDDATIGLAGGYWDAADAGLGAGDALLVDLQRLEQRYLETNLRQLEVEQSFSLVTLDPRALLTLRETGRCTFTIPETAFDLAYPGQYRRRIKAVRVSIPCVTGPYANVPATLRLTRGQWRVDPLLDAALTEIPLRHTTAIATSSGQADTGSFEFSFRDERFLPFEGAGAISEWELELPDTFRPFDYRTISDVIVRLGYTAEYDEGLRADVEDAASIVAQSLRKQLETGGLPLCLSVRQDQPAAWRQLVDSPPGTDVTLTIDTRHLPGVLADWLGGRALPAAKQPRLTAGSVSLALVTDPIASRVKPTAEFSAGVGANAPAALAFGNAPSSLGLYEASLPGTASLDRDAPEIAITVRVDDAGNLAPPAAADASSLDEATLRDVVVLVRVRATST